MSARLETVMCKMCLEIISFTADFPAFFSERSTFHVILLTFTLAFYRNTVIFATIDRPPLAIALPRANFIWLCQVVVLLTRHDFTYYYYPCTLLI